MPVSFAWFLLSREYGIHSLFIVPNNQDINSITE